MASKRTAGLGYTSPLWIGAAMSAAALVVLVVADRAVAVRHLREAELIGVS